MLRATFAASLAVALGSLATAPFQCGHGVDPGLRQEETAGDALWALAQRFADAGDRAAEKRTYQFIVEKYPSSRYAPAAQDELAK